MKRSLAILCLVSAGCSAPNFFTFICPSGTSNGGGGSGGSSDTGGEGGAGASTTMCPDPILGYDPSETADGPLFPLGADVGGIVAARLEAFSQGTTCETLIVGFVNSPAPCAVPSTIDIVMGDSVSPNLPPDGVAVTTTLSLDNATITPTPTPGVLEARFAFQSTHIAGLFPYVGAIVQPDFCPAVMPVCDLARAVRYRSQPPWKGWHLLSQTVNGLPGTFGNLYFGLADCGGS